MSESAWKLLHKKRKDRKESNDGFLDVIMTKFSENNWHCQKSK